MSTLTKSVALSVSLLAATNAHADVEQCSTKKYSAWSDLSSGGTGKIYLRVKTPAQTPDALKGVLQGTFDKKAADNLIHNHCQTGNLEFDKNLMANGYPLKKYKLSTADNKRSVEVTHRNNGSDYTLKDGTEFTEERKYSGRVTLRSATIFLETGVKPAFN